MLKLPLRFLLAALLFGAGFGVSAQPAVSVTPGPVEARDVRAWLMRIHDAARRENFQGTFVVSSAGVVSSARIAHYRDGSNQLERIESLDGQARQVFRNNELVHTLWSQSRVAVLERRDTLSTFPALLQSGDDRIVEFYDVHLQGAERMAGHEATVLLLRPRDGLRYGYRLWSEKKSGLLLRADVLNDRNQVLESSAFSEVTIGVKSQPESVSQPMKKLDGYRVIRPVMTPARLDEEGWSLRQSVTGFRPVSCFKRPLDLVAPSDAGDASAQPKVGVQALQAIYSDGLTYVSVFVEPFDARRHTQAVLTSMGATQTLMRRQGDWWFTVIGDVPAETLRAFANGLERKSQ